MHCCSTILGIKFSSTGVAIASTLKWIQGCAEVSCAKTIREVRAIVGAIIAKSHGWWDRFRACHPQLSLRAGESLAYVCAVNNRQIIGRYFDLLEDIFTEYSLKGRVFNLDESGIPLPRRPGRRIGIKGQKPVDVITSGNKTNITGMLACVSASGYSMPPMVIFNRKSLSGGFRHISPFSTENPSA